MKLKNFLDKYDTVIFDLDGVITSESAYWDAAALTAYQQIQSKEFFDDFVDVNYYMSHIKEIRREVFSEDKLIAVLKNKGVNSNWDLTYVTLGIAIMMQTKDFGKCLEYAENFNGDIFEMYNTIAHHIEKKLKINDASRTSEFWERLRMRFQEWVLGEEIFTNFYGYGPSQKNKPGLLKSEQPVVDGEKLKAIFKTLKMSGKRLCTATGRTFEELEPPLKKFEIFDYFAADGFINFNHVTEIHNKFGIQVTKPHPYMFQKALYGNEFPDIDILEENFEKGLIKNTLIVGDAGADILAAKAMGADFCAVLTGIAGNNVRGYFEKLNSEYILESILDFEERGVFDA